MTRKKGDKIAEAILAQHHYKFEDDYTRTNIMAGIKCWDAWLYDQTGNEELVCTHIEDAEIARNMK